MTTKDKPAHFGRVVRHCSEGDRIYLERDGIELGHIDFTNVPRDARVKIALTFDRTIRIIRKDSER